MSKTILIFILGIVSLYTVYSDDSKETEKLFKKGQKYLNEKKYDKADSVFSVIINSDSSNKIYFYNRGLTRLMMNNFVPALFDFNYSIKLDTNYADAYNSRGLAYSYLGLQDTAMYDFNKAIDLDQNFSEAYISRGSVYIIWKNYPAAISDLTKAVELNPKNPEAYNQRANAYYKQKKYNESLEDYSQAIKKGINIPEIFYNRGNVYYKLNKVELAIEDYSKSLELNPDQPEVLNNRAVAYDKIKEFDKADSDREILKKLVGTNLKEIPFDSLKFNTYVLNSKSGDSIFSLSLPENWFDIKNSNDTVYEMAVSPEKISADSLAFSVGVYISYVNHMKEQYQVSGRESILEFWKGSNLQNIKEYSSYEILSEKKFIKEEWAGWHSKVRIKIDDDGMLTTLYEYVLAGDNSLFFSYFQCPSQMFSYYKKIFDQAIESIKIKKLE